MDHAELLFSEDLKSGRVSAAVGRWHQDRTATTLSLVRVQKVGQRDLDHFRQLMADPYFECRNLVIADSYIDPVFAQTLDKQLMEQEALRSLTISGSEIIYRRTSDALFTLVNEDDVIARNLVQSRSHSKRPKRKMPYFLSRYMASATLLTHVSLSNCVLPEKILKAFIRSVALQPTMINLKLANLNIKPSLMLSFYEAAENTGMSNLETLSIPGNHSSRIAAFRLAKFISFNKNLSQVDLMDTGISTPEFKMLCSSISYKKDFSIDLRKNDYKLPAVRFAMGMRALKLSGQVQF